MPPRTVTLGIVALWLAAVGWMGYHEWLRPLAQPPLLDRTDEVGRQIARWRYHVNGADVSSVQLEIFRNPRDRFFTLAAKYNAKDGFNFRDLPIQQLGTECRTTPRGELRQLSYEVQLGARQPVSLEGTLNGEDLTADLFCGQRKHKKRLKSFHATAPTGLFNLLAPVHRMPGLYEGRQWQVLALDPLEAALTQGADGVTYPLEATTTADRLEWHGLTVPCWRVDYRRDGKLRARVWGRQDNGLALRQEVHYDDTEIALQREQLHDEGGRRFPGLPRLPR